MGKIFNAIANFFSYHHKRQQLVEDYLGTSTDLVDLERRQRDLARKGIY